MKVLICPDKFKFTFSSVEIAGLMAKAVENVLRAQIKIIPLSDGGEGFLDVVARVKDLEPLYAPAYDPLGRPVDAPLLWDTSTNTAYVELAKTGSLSLLFENEANPMRTTTFGFGHQLRLLLERDVDKIYAGLGGSSTTDLGIGMAYALKYVFLDKKGNKLAPVGENLLKIDKILQPWLKLWKGKSIFACVDVENPLYGENGAAYVYAPQKGATAEEVEILDKGLRHVSEVIKRDLGKDVANIKGGGAAGGLAAGMVAFLDAQIIPGADFIFNLTGLEEQIKDADIIITGEGKFDSQTRSGKLVWKVVQLAAKYDKPVLIVAGTGSNSDLPVRVDLLSLFDDQVDIETANRETEQRLEKKLVKYLAEKYPDACK